MVKLRIRVCHSGHITDFTASKGEVLNSPAHRLSGQRPPELPAAPAALMDTIGMEEREQCLNDCGAGGTSNTVGPRITWAASAPNAHLPGFWSPLLKSRIEIQGFRKTVHPISSPAIPPEQLFSWSIGVISPWVGVCMDGCARHMKHHLQLLQGNYQDSYFQNSAQSGPSAQESGLHHL